MTVRAYQRSDTPQLLTLMKELAVFEDYIGEFAVTEQALEENGLGEHAVFKAFVCEEDGRLIGMAVTYVIPWTYTLTPKLVLKELFVSESGRGKGVGKALMEAVKTHAIEIGAREVVWTVMTGNEAAERFYRSFGGRPDLKWNNWALKV